MKTLYKELENYAKSDYYPFHMPGHKRNSSLSSFANPFSIDITEIEGFDNLHHAEGIIKSAEEEAAKVYQADETHFLINGSTAGLLSAICGVTKKRDCILTARNCHKAVYHGIFLMELQAVYLYPQEETLFGINGGIFPEEVDRMMKTFPNIKAVVITSPTYDGIVSDIKRIADIVHGYEIPLIVDEAHGAHFGFHEYFPDTAIKAGADIVIHSLHKTLPSLTQTALIHINGNLVDREMIKKYLSIYQTSSPSYILMASIQECIQLLKNRKEELFESFVKILKRSREDLKNMRNLMLLDAKYLDSASFFDLDRSKILISTKNTFLSGKELYDILLNKYHLQMEMMSTDYILGITSISDTAEGFERLVDALMEIDSSITRDSSITKDSNITKDSSITRDSNITKDSSIKSSTAFCAPLIQGKIVKSIAEAEEADKELVLLENSLNKISGEYIYLYPPGIPILVPGEEISKELLLNIRYYQENKLVIKGITDGKAEKIKVLKEF